MSIDSSLVGTSSAPQTFEVTKEAVQHFMAAAEDPTLQSDAPLRYAPPTFPTTFRMRVPGLELDPTKMQLLHGEQEYKYTRPIRVGEQVTCVVRVVDISQRTGGSGPMTLLVLETTGTDSNQQLIFTARSTSIIRMK